MGSRSSLRRTYGALVALAAVSAAAGCATPVIHPLRATNGPILQVATSFEGSHGKQGVCNNFEGCVDGTGPFLWNLLELSGGWSEVWDDRFGTMVGLYAPAFENLKDPHVYALAALWSFFTIQNDYASAGVGPEIGAGGVAMTIGGEVGGRSLWAPRVGGYGRWFWPFDPNHEERDGRLPTWEAGPRLRFGPVFAQYTFYTQREGIMYWTFWETAGYARGNHILTLGFSLDREIVRAYP